MTYFPPASIHGRFQIIHLEHLEYFERAYQKYGRIYIGLTGLRMHLNQPEGRGALANNPLTFAELAAMWRAVLDVKGFRPGDFEIGPFPIEKADYLADFVPRTCVCATTIREDWNEVKIRQLKEMGYAVDVLYENRVKKLSSSRVRDLIRQGSDEWLSLVPAGVPEFLSRIDVLDRLRETIKI